MPVKRRATRYREAVQSSDVNVVFDEIFVLLSNSFAAMLFLLVMGVLLAGGTLTGFTFAAVVLGAIIDLASEVWLFKSPLQYPDARLQQVIRVHYALQVLAYGALVLAVLDVLPVRRFFVYSAFLLLWIVGFVIGEAVVIFMDDRYETRHGE